jgi:hypothetical protein
VGEKILSPVCILALHFFKMQFNSCRRDISVGIATGLRAEPPRNQGKIPGRDKRILSSPSSSRPALGPRKPPIHQVAGAVFLGIKRLVREADHSPPSSAEVKNGGTYLGSTIRLHDLMRN